MKKNLIQVCSVLNLLFVLACGSGGSSAICGNGIVESSEACDDANKLNDDACSTACELNFRSQSLSQRGGLIQYIYAGKIDQQPGVDLLVLISQNQNWSFDSYSSFLTNSVPKNIDGFAEVSSGPNGSITRKLTSYDVGDVNEDGLLDLVYFFVSQEILSNPNQYKLNMNLNYLQNIQGDSFSSKNLLHPLMQEVIIGDGDLVESGDIIENIKIAEFGEGKLGPNLIFNRWNYNKEGPISLNDGSNNFLKKKNDKETFYNLGNGIGDNVPYGSKFIIGRLDQSDANWEILYTDTRIFTIPYDPFSLDFSTEPPTLTTTSTVSQVTIQDFNGDNLNDLVVLTNNELLWTENLGVPSFGSLKSISTQPITHIETGDLDRDGLGDILAFSSANGGEILYFHNEGGGIFSTGSLVKNTGTITAQHLVDADEDGDLDLVYAVGSELFFLENQI